MTHLTFKDLNGSHTKFPLITENYKEVEKSLMYIHSCARSTTAHNSLIDAKRNCSMDRTCEGILEEFNNVGAFFTCHGGFQLIVQDPGGRVESFYQKQDMFGE